MGSDFLKDITPTPLTLRDCLIDGELNLNRCWYYRKRLDTRIQSLERHNSGSHNKLKHKDAASLSVTKRAIQSVKRHKTLVRDADVHLQEIKPEDTLWYLLYVSQPPMNAQMHKLFCLRFRMPYASFEILADSIANHHLFQRWTRTDAVGENPSNMNLLILCFVRGHLMTYQNQMQYQ